MTSWDLSVLKSTNQRQLLKNQRLEGSVSSSPRTATRVNHQPASSPRTPVRLHHQPNSSPRTPTHLQHQSNSSPRISSRLDPQLTSTPRTPTYDAHHPSSSPRALHPNHHTPNHLQHSTDDLVPMKIVYKKTTIGYVQNSTDEKAKHQTYISSTVGIY